MSDLYREICKCGAPTVPTDYNVAGTEVQIALLCQTCQEEAEWEHLALRAEFNQLLEQGVHRAMANRIMIVRMEHRRASQTG